MRRLLSVLAVAGVALAGLVLPAAGQTPPTIAITPTSDAAGSTGTWSIAITGDGWPAGRQVSVSFAGEALASPTADRAGRFAVTINPARRYAGRYRVDAFNNVCAPTASCPRSATTDFVAVPAAQHNDPCGPVGSKVTIAITGTNFPPQSFGYVLYDPEGPDQQSVNRIPTGDGTFTASLSVVVPNRSITIFVYDIDGNRAPNLTWTPAPCPTSTSTTTTSTSTTAPPDDTVPDSPTTTTTEKPGIPFFPVPGTTVPLPPSVDVPPPTPGATLTLTPRIGPTGFVALARGTGFPPGPVEVRWSPGIGSVSAVVGPDGTFTVRALVFPKDRLGPRALIATGGTTSAYDAFLVVPSSVQPSAGRDVARITRNRRFMQR